MALETMDDHWLNRHHQTLELVLSLVPNLPLPPTADLDISRHGCLDHVQRSALRTAALAIRPGLADGALDAVVTLGELVDLLGESSESVGFQRGAYRTDRVTLRAVRRAEYDRIYEATLDPRNAFRWRYRGRTPSPEEFHNMLFSGVAAQFAAARVSDDRLLGMVTAYDENPDAGHCHVAFLRCDNSEEVFGALVEAVALLIDYMFTTFPLKKVFAEVPSYNSYLVSGVVGDLLQHDASIPDYYWYNSHLWDLNIYSLHRSRWESFANAWTSHDLRQDATPSVTTPALRASAGWDAE